MPRRQSPHNAPLPSLSEGEILNALKAGMLQQRELLATAYNEPMTSNDVIDRIQIEKVLAHMLEQHHLNGTVALFPFFDINADQLLFSALESKIRQDRRYKSWLPPTTPLASIPGLNRIGLQNRMRAEFNRNKKDAALKAEAVRLLVAQGLTQENLLNYHLRAMNDPVILGFNFDQAEQWIIPFLMEDHITMMVGQRDRTTNTVHLFYYNSKNHDLEPAFRQSLIDFHRYLPFRPAVNYLNISHFDQPNDDKVNCGVLSVMKVMDKVCAFKGIQTQYFKTAPHELIQFRQNMAQMLQTEYVGSNALPNPVGVVTHPPVVNTAVANTAVVNTAVVNTAVVNVAVANTAVANAVNSPTRSLGAGAPISAAPPIPLPVLDPANIESPNIVLHNHLFSRRNIMIAGVISVLIVACFMMPALILMMGKSFLESTLALMLGVGVCVGLGVMSVNWIMKVVGLDAPEPGGIIAQQEQAQELEDRMDNPVSPMLGVPTEIHFPPVGASPIVPQFQQASAAQAPNAPAPVAATVPASNAPAPVAATVPASNAPAPAPQQPSSGPRP